MPIFGLVWVASWVGCFFSSSQDLLRAPAALARVLPLQAVYRVSGARDERSVAASRDQVISVLPSQQVQPFGSMMPTVPQAQALSLALAFDASSILSAPVDFLGAFKNLFSSFQKFTASRSTPPVVVVQAEPKRETKTSIKQVSSGLGFGHCLSIAQRNAKGGTNPRLKHQTKSLFQVKIKDSIVGSVFSQRQAKQLANHLEQALDSATASEAKVPFDQLQPGLINGVPGGKLGDRILFTVDQQMANQWDCHPEVLAIQWVNALRTALAEPPLALADAQAKMRGLQATGERLEGIASWYGPYFHGRQTATGERFNQNDFTAAHPSLPFDTYLKVTNRNNGKAVIVRVNDRGPYFDNRTLDLSREAARSLDSETNGVVPVEAEIMQPATSTADLSKSIARRL
ncbi:septal ring lytic transglycosylase RlpA family protein [Leptolyngbya sp. FACHB-321]|uniref:septal ring lytic transglycosylase RlpA family protein n=1 Tax=Leptolyngbya sp. FACHB-321 TaxID=2692807 RepID=UPI001688DC85|nr:septal ring lytic transglycosylase RlpA family protein [Leptolyngbya sp. FACHB-321]MBD2037578.1 septal ring lytic transglycosylase RlpA family protein [Leptolyngbya sp. FACHB-321]